MSDIPMRLLIVTFEDEKASLEALKLLKDLHKEQLVEIADAVVIWRDDHDKLHIRQTVDLTGGKSAAVGGLLGALLGIIAGPGGVVAGAAVGALVGGAAAGVIDLGIPDARLKEIGKSLGPNTSAIAALVDESWAAEVERRLAMQGGNVTSEPFKTKPAQRAADDAPHRALREGDALAEGGMVEIIPE